ncbi:MAG: LPS export ABC transporter periplasmic protein LptC [Spirochaetota bacterium]|nr:LPS export ABC transporter periplasmic protein LptC [Spirochaetota bacterium]
MKVMNTSPKGVVPWFMMIMKFLSGLWESRNFRFYILVFIIIINHHCRRSMPLDPASFRPDMRVKNFTTFNYMEGSIAWEIDAEESSYYFNEKRSIAEQVVMDYYEDNVKTAVVNARRAIIHTDSHDIELIGEVDILSSSGNRLLTPKVRWNNQSKLLDTEEHVRIFRKNGDVVEGIGLRADYDLENYEIKRKVIAITKNAGQKRKEGGKK